MYIRICIYIYVKYVYIYMYLYSYIQIIYTSCHLTELGDSSKCLGEGVSGDC